jgi:hypothetical protein
MPRFCHTARGLRFSPVFGVLPADLDAIIDRFFSVHQVEINGLMHQAWGQIHTFAD